MSSDYADAGVALLVPALQAAATILILEKQKDLYDDIADDRKDSIDGAVATFIASVDAQIALGSFREAYGSVPEAILYEKIDMRDEGMEAAESSLIGIPAAKRYIEAANRIMEQDNIVRAMMLDGRYVCDNELISCTINQMLSGEVPISDLSETIRDVAEGAAFRGNVGNTDGVTRLDLGISQHRMRIAGQQAFQSHLESINRDVSPISRSVSLREFTQTPEQRLGLALSEAQLIQQSLQNQANAAVAGDPTAYGELQTKLNEAVLVLGNEAQRGNISNAFVPNYAALLAPAIESISEGLLGDSSGDADKKTTQTNITSSGKNPVI